MNNILSALSSQESQYLSSHLKPVWLEKGQTLHRAEDEITSVYFPEQALVSLMMFNTNGSSCDVGVIGSEGMVGIPVIFGSFHSNVYALVQIAGTAQKLAVSELVSEYQRGGNLQQKLLQFVHVFLFQTMQTAMYSTLHSVETRLARWLLLAQECTQLNELPFTQEFLSEMLGVRRATVSEIAGSWSDEGIIVYRRGRIAIKSQAALESKVGEEYRYYHDQLAQYREAPEHSEYPTQPLTGR